MGYGYQWRHFNGSYTPGKSPEGGYDQLQEVINLIKPIGKHESVSDDDVVNLLNYSELVKESRKND